MTRRFFGLQGALLGMLAIGSCKQDSITTVGIGTPAAVAVELHARTVLVADSVRTFAVVTDKVGNPLSIPVTFATGCTAGIVSVGSASDAPLVRTAFIVRALAYGNGCVIASAAGFVDTMKVTTLPASLVVTGVAGTVAGKPDTANSGSVVTYSYAYKDKAGVVMTGLPASTVPTLSSADTTIAKPTALTVAGRAPGVVTLTLRGLIALPAGVVDTLSALKSLAVLAIPFTGTTSSPADPGAILTVNADPTGPPFDANTATTIGSIITGSLTATSFQVRISDLSSAGAHSFSVTGVGPNDIAYSGGTYTTNAPAAFGGTFAPAPVTPSDTITVTAAAGDPAFSATMKVFRGTSVGSLAAVTPVSGSITATSFKLLTADLDDGGTYTVQITRLGASNLARRGTYTLAVGTYGGTVSPSSGGPASKIVLHRAAGDPPFSTAMRVYFDGIRAWIDTSKGFSTDTVIVAVPPVLHTGSVDLRISRIGAAQQAENALGGFTSTTASPLDAYGYSNITPDKPAPITANGNYYITMAGVCPNGSPANGGEKCDAYFKITNGTAVDATVTMSVNWLTGGIDPDLLWCKGTALSNPPPNNVPACGTVAGGADVLGCACSVSEGPPESITFTLPKNSVYVVWVNLFDGSGAPANLMRFQISGLP